MREAVKFFEVREGNTENMWYQIQVYHMGNLIDTFLFPTMSEAYYAFRDAGYYFRPLYGS
jgi:hypothetical protein